MREVVVAGSGLHCALGNTVDTAVGAMLRGVCHQSELTIEALGEPISMPWYGIDCEHNYRSATRFEFILNSVVAQALDDVDLTAEQKSRMGLFLGSSSFEVGPSEVRYQNDLMAKGRDDAMPMQLVSIGHLTAQLRRRFGVRGPDFVYGTACSASANAVLGAQRLLDAGLIDHALVVGVELYNLTTLAGFHSMQLISPDRIRPFDRHRSGMILGEACAAVVLSAQNRVDRDASEVAIAGGASNCDTSSVTATSSDGVAIARVVNAALSDAALSPEDVAAIKAHGTASEANDLAEATAMTAVFEELPPFVSLKPYIGHNLGACGVVELVLLEAALRRGLLPATPGFETLDSAIGIEPSSASQSVQAHGHYLLSYFGFGGNNTVLVLSHG